MKGDGLDSLLKTASELDVTEERAVIKFCVIAGKTPFETKQLLDECGDRSKVSRSMVYKWYKRFKEGRCETWDDERSGRPPTIDSDLTASVLQDLEKDRRLTVRDIADKFEISTSTAHETITKSLGFEKVCARWVPKLLSTDEKNRRIVASKEFLRRWENEGELFLNRIITTDETWLHLFDPETKQQSMMWKRKGSPPPKKAKVARSHGKHMFILFMDIQGIILAHAVPNGQHVNADYYAKVIRRDLVQALRKKRPNFADLCSVIFHQDNAPAHRSQSTMLELDLLGFDLLQHPPYSPDLAPMDFALFPYLKSRLRGQKFDDLEELRCATSFVLKDINESWCRNVFQKWVERHQKCVKLSGVYFEKE